MQLVKVIGLSTMPGCSRQIDWIFELTGVGFSMSEQEHIQLISDFLSKQRFLVVATTWEHQPQAAVVAFSNSSVFEIIFSTFDTTRKFRNVQSDSRVALVIGWDEFVTVQCEGVAHVTTGNEEVECKRVHIEKHPESEKYSFDQRNRYLKVVTQWIRYTDITCDPEFTFEIRV